MFYLVPKFARLHTNQLEYFYFIFIYLSHPFSSVFRFEYHTFGLIFLYLLNLIRLPSPPITLHARI